MPAAGPRGALRGHQRPTRGRQGPVSAPNVEYWRDRLPAWRHCYFRSFKTVSLGTKLNEASMVTLTHIFFFSSICNLACCVCIRQEVDCLNSHLDPIVALLGRLLLLLLQRLRSLVLEGRRGLLEHRLVSGSLEQR